MLVSRDIYEYITNFVNDKTILILLSVNKKFNSDESYKRLLGRKYPHLIKFKKRSESFKKLFIRMKNYINKLSKRFDFPYIPSPEFNPYDFYMEITNNDTYDPDSEEEFYKPWSQKLEEWWSEENPLREMWNEGLRYSSHTSDEKLMTYMLDKGAYDVDAALYNAAHRGNKKMVDYVLKLKRSDWIDKDWNYEKALIASCTGGQLEMAQFFISKGANKLDKALQQSGCGGNIDLMGFLIQKGAKLEKFKKRYHNYFPELYDLEFISEDEYYDYLAEYGSFEEDEEE